MVLVVGGHQGAGGKEPVAQLDATAASQMVVAGPRLAQRGGALVFAQRGHRRRRRELGYGLERRGDQGAR